MPSTTAAQAMPEGAQRQLVVLAVGLVLAMSPWFSTAAVLGQLREQWDLSSGAASWLIIAVQLGFVMGAVGSSIARLADRLAPRRLILIGAGVAAVANASIVLFDAYAAAVVGRLVTGAALALVYPPALKAMSGWFVARRGFALGVMIGALTVGSALPHLINALGDLSWRGLMLAVSGLTVIGGLIADQLGEDGPHTARASVFDPSQVREILTNTEFRLASIGYFGHMWELYAMWAWIAAFYRDAFDSPRAASLAAFAVIGIGAAGSMYVGGLSDRRSRSFAAELSMRWSALVALVIGFLLHAPDIVVLGAGLLWGFWVVADSAQFSTIVTEAIDIRFVGTALTIQLAAGFTLTVFTIFLVPIVRDALGWGFAFMMLAPGPVVGAWAMQRLRAT